jgi:hypothetical protein
MEWRLVAGGTRPRDARGTFAPEQNLNNLLHFSWNPGRIGEYAPLLGGVQLGLEVSARLLVFDEGSPVGRHLEALGQLLPVRSGARPGGQRLLGRGERLVVK